MSTPDPAEKPRPRGPADAKPFEVMSSLWAEYQYRHDMIWKLAFRITAVAAALLIAPFLADESVPDAVGRWLLVLPILAIVVIAGGLITVPSELGRLRLIRRAYRRAQREVLAPYLTPGDLKEVVREDGWFSFGRRVVLYLVVLLLAAIVYAVAMGKWWLDKLVE